MPTSIAQSVSAWAKSALFAMSSCLIAWRNQAGAIAAMNGFLPDRKGVISRSTFMEGNLTAYYLRYTIRATEALELEQHPGSALRGSLFQALLKRFCVNQDAPECASCPLVQTCPVRALVAPLRDEFPRGRDVPRPFVVRPPLIAAAGQESAALRLEAGEQVTF